MSKTTKHCANCNNTVKGNFCTECGQSIKTSRIDLSHLVEELQFSFLHINKGMIYTVKELILKPGYTIKSYLSGKRVQYFKPFTFLLIWGSIYGLVLHFFNVYPDSEMNRQNNAIFDINYIYNWYYSHYSLIQLLIIPFYALSSYVLYRKSNYNYIEHLVISSYTHGVKVIILLLFYPAFYYSHSRGVYLITLACLYIYNIYVLVEVFKTSSWFKAILKAVISIVLTLIVASITIIVILEGIHHFLRIF
ncbi:uncharacterized protein DUF3667 [Dysgonomonas alginatilytica]|uniref:Uncharacterized protein DUF3667 n=1 Tax=Dysgonomonas alginatilytica TaxID=1605892 RepID=A0A2V3PHN4_9BACT|nr:DUF3667 domain-containing protein [Dysgonomonas alginatilytica]PXV58478.1 uncharacterized protein DUF3667 [Dysgonomonas alginatilytica]